MGDVIHFTSEKWSACGAFSNLTTKDPTKVTCKISITELELIEKEV